MNWKHKIIKTVCRKFPKLNILDIGCQHGKLPIDRTRYYGLDIDKSYSKFWMKGHFKVGDIRKRLPYRNNSVDFIYCNHVLEHINEDEQAFFAKECHRILKKEGILLLFTPTPYHWFFWDHPEHKRASTHGSLITLFCKRTGFKLQLSKYAKTRLFPQSWQSMLRLFLRPFLWDVAFAGEKP